MRASQRFTIDGNDVCSADQINLDQPFVKGSLELFWLEHAEHRVCDGVVRRYAVSQLDKLPQPAFADVSELLDVLPAFRYTHHRQNRQYKNVQQVMKLRAFDLGSSITAIHSVKVVC